MASHSKHPWSRHFKKTDALAAAQIAAQSTRDVIDVTEQLHLSIQQRYVPVRWLTTTTQWVYTGVRLLPSAAHHVMKPIARYLSENGSDPEAECSEERLNVIAAINGLLGDQLAEVHSPLAISMHLIRPHHERYSHKLLLVHGLCMDDRAWGTEQIEHIAQTVKADVWRLKYNTGLNIKHNGLQLAELLNSLVTEQTLLTLVGHSMGGLVALHALQTAQEKKYPWPAQTRSMVTLGTPFTGAPLAHWGHWAEEQISISAMTRPFTLFSKRRSEGIQNLKQGYANPLPTGLKLPVLCIAGALKPKGLAKLDEQLGDGLVTEQSALALAGSSEHWVAEGVGHLSLLKSPLVYQRVGEFLRQCDLQPRIQPS